MIINIFDSMKNVKCLKNGTAIRMPSKRSHNIKARKDKLVAQLQYLICYHDYHYGDKTFANYTIIRINEQKFHVQSLMYR